jgi:spore germination protein KA
LTNVTVLWVQGITNPELVRRMEKRLSSIDIDGLLTPSAVEEYITGSRMTPFPLLQYTERTDRFCQGLLQGRVGLLVDGIPLGYLAPVDIGYLMDSPEDLTRDFLSASWVRLLRYGALLLGLLLPAVYMAAAMGNLPGMPVAIAEIIARNRVSFSPVWEVLGMLLAFELLQESGVHLPQNIGQSVSIIGGIVVGTAGVEAGLISSMALIVVSTAGVCGFVLPNRDLAAAVRLCRFLLAIFAAILGMWGILLGLAILVVHLASLRSMGVAYLRIFRSAFLRTRLKKNIRRDPALKPVDRRNQR